MEYKNEFVDVEMCYGYGIVFKISVLAEIGCPEDKIKAEAIRVFKEFMPNEKQVNEIEERLDTERAWIRFTHEFDENDIVIIDKLKEYRKEVDAQLKKNTSGFSEDVDKTLKLKGELKAINKMIKMF